MNYDLGFIINYRSYHGLCIEEYPFPRHWPKGGEVTFYSKIPRRHKAGLAFPFAFH